MNMAEMLRNPQAALLQLDRTRALLLRQMQVQEAASYPGPKIAVS
jgi:hypothetical protein